MYIKIEIRCGDCHKEIGYEWVKETDHYVADTKPCECGSLRKYINRIGEQESKPQTECSWCGHSETWKWCSEEHKEHHILTIISNIRNEQDSPEIWNKNLCDALEILFSTKEDINV